MTTHRDSARHWLITHCLRSRQYCSSPLELRCSLQHSCGARRDRQLARSPSRTRGCARRTESSRWSESTTSGHPRHHDRQRRIRRRRHWRVPRAPDRAEYGMAREVESGCAPGGNLRSARIRGTSPTHSIRRHPQPTRRHAASEREHVIAPRLAVVAGVFALSHTVDHRDEWRHE
jgi:hypothetical protein